MSSHVTTLDITTMPSLRRMVEEAQKSNNPRLVIWHGDPVAILMPLKTGAESHETIDIHEGKPMQELKTSFLNAGYPEAEVNDMLEALSELPQYAGQAIR